MKKNRISFISLFTLSALLLQSMHIYTMDPKIPIKEQEKEIRRNVRFSVSLKLKKANTIEDKITRLNWERRQAVNSSSPTRSIVIDELSNMQQEINLEKEMMEKNLPYQEKVTFLKRKIAEEPEYARAANTLLPKIQKTFKNEIKQSVEKSFDELTPKPGQSFAQAKKLKLQAFIRDAQKDVAFLEAHPYIPRSLETARMTLHALESMLPKYPISVSEKEIIEDIQDKWRNWMRRIPESEITEALLKLIVTEAPTDIEYKALEQLLLQRDIQKDDIKANLSNTIKQFMAHYKNNINSLLNTEEKIKYLHNEMIYVQNNFAKQVAIEALLDEFKPEEQGAEQNLAKAKMLKLQTLIRNAQKEVAFLEAHPYIPRSLEKAQKTLRTLESKTPKDQMSLSEAEIIKDLQNKWRNWMNKRTIPETEITGELLKLIVTTAPTDIEYKALEQWLLQRGVQKDDITVTISDAIKKFMLGYKSMINSMFSTEEKIKYLQNEMIKAQSNFAKQMAIEALLDELKPMEQETEQSLAQMEQRVLTQKQEKKNDKTFEETKTSWINRLKMQSHGLSYSNDDILKNLVLFHPDSLDYAALESILLETGMSQSALQQAVNSMTQHWIKIYKTKLSYEPSPQAKINFLKNEMIQAKYSFVKQHAIGILLGELGVEGV